MFGGTVGELWKVMCQSAQPDYKSYLIYKKSTTKLFSMKIKGASQESFGKLVWIFFLYYHSRFLIQIMVQVSDGNEHSNPAFYTLNLIKMSMIDDRYKVRMRYSKSILRNSYIISLKIKRQRLTVLRQAMKELVTSTVQIKNQENLDRDNMG